jgi:hypothetical protein
MTPQPKKEKMQKPVTTPKRDVSLPKDTDQPQNAPSSKKGLKEKPDTSSTAKRKVDTPKDADQPQNEPATKPKR